MTLSLCLFPWMHRLTITASSGSALVTKKNNALVIILKKVTERYKTFIVLSKQVGVS